MQESAMRQLIEQYTDAYNRFDVDAMLSTLHKDIRFENISDGKVTLSTIGIEAFREAAEKAKHIFRERHQTVENIVFESMSATVHIDYFGVLAVDLSDTLKAGDTMSLKGRSIFRFQDNAIIHLVDFS
ncbi:nuclear transport factor 2 family protein [bacterium]|nr:nuclear transport factor 2 family protein [bacterium]